MSKSYKKFPVVRQERVNKKLANRQLRRVVLKNIDYAIKGSQYKKLTLVDDWHYIWTKQDAIERYLECDYLYKQYITLGDYLDFWERCTIRK